MKFKIIEKPNRYILKMGIKKDKMNELLDALPSLPLDEETGLPLVPPVEYVAGVFNSALQTFFTQLKARELDEEARRAREEKQKALRFYKPQDFFEEDEEE